MGTSSRSLYWRLSQRPRLVALCEDVYRTDVRGGEKESAREDAAGSGLGLAVVRRIVELHGERIEEQSPQGSGTTVSFTLPVRK